MIIFWQNGIKIYIKLIFEFGIKNLLNENNIIRISIFNENEKEID